MSLELNTVVNIWCDHCCVQANWDSTDRAREQWMESLLWLTDETDQYTGLNCSREVFGAANKRLSRLKRFAVLSVRLICDHDWKYEYLLQNRWPTLRKPSLFGWIIRCWFLAQSIQCALRFVVFVVISSRVVCVCCCCCYLHKQMTRFMLAND